MLRIGWSRRIMRFFWAGLIAQALAPKIILHGLPPDPGMKLLHFCLARASTFASLGPPNLPPRANTSAMPLLVSEDVV